MYVVVDRWSNAYRQIDDRMFDKKKDSLELVQWLKLILIQSLSIDTCPNKKKTSNIKEISNLSNIDVISVLVGHKFSHGYCGNQHNNCYCHGVGYEVGE